ncbi:MAG: uridine kinase family protein [Chlamydiia bacterium]
MDTSASSNEPSFIFITGGSGSGKTSFAQSLVNRLGEATAACINLDDYLDKRVQPEARFIDGIPNFDHPSMINWELLIRHIAALREGQAIDSPVYDFSSWMPSGWRHIPWKPVVVIEGIHATQRPLEVIPGLRVFIDVGPGIRYQRRLHRDMREKNYSLEMIQKTFFEMALPNQKLFLDPTQDSAHIVIKDLEGEVYSQLAISYILQTLNKFRPTHYENLRVCLKHHSDRLIEENIQD